MKSINGAVRISSRK